MTRERDGMAGARGALLDHVAVAVPDRAEPGAWLQAIGARSGGAEEAPGFVAEQWHFRGGMKLELLVPFRTTENDFVLRFLSDHGPGPHHLTFLVDDLRQAVDAAEAAGYPVLSVRFDNPAWQEAFLHPHDACGTVVQLARTGARRRTLAAPGPADLTGVHLEVADLDRAAMLYRDLLGGRVVAEEIGRLTLSWPGSGSITLHAADPAALGGRIGRVARLDVAGLTGQERISWAPIGMSMGSSAVRSTSIT